MLHLELGSPLNKYAREFGQTYIAEYSKKNRNFIWNLYSQKIAYKTKINHEES